MSAVVERVDGLEQALADFTRSVGIELNKRYIGTEPRDLVVRFKRRLADGRREEVDALAVTGELVVLNSTKATLRSADVDAFVTQIGRFRECFPEYGTLPVVGLLATLSVDDSVPRHAERSGFLVAAVGEAVMELKHHAGFEPRRWH